MSSLLARTLRRLFSFRRTKPSTDPVVSAPSAPQLTYDRAQGTVALRHEFYGDLRLFANDPAISQHLLDGRTIWEEYLVAQFARHFPVGRNVIDAGANLGLHSIALAKLAKHGEKVFAFEPHPEIFPLTQSNCAAYPNVRCIPQAASDTRHTVYMNSIHGLSNQAGADVHEQGDDSMFAVPAVPIDSLDLPDIGLMKIDVEHHEIECIRGARETIRRDKPILFVEVYGGHDIATAPPEIAAEIRARIQFICDLGYDAQCLHVHDYLFTPR